MLKFSPANAKTRKLAECNQLKPYLTGKRKVYSLDLLSGHNCPYANECLSKVVVDGGKHKIQDGPNTKFRCFSASQEVIYTNVYKLRAHNSAMIKMYKSAGDMYTTIYNSMPKDLGICRIHVAGDFFNQNYFDAWRDIANTFKDRLFYAYTKSLPFWIMRLGHIPENFVLTASRGGRMDKLIPEFNLREAVVVYSEEEADKLGLEIDHDDTHAATSGPSFALLIHGIQPKGSQAAQALKDLKGKGSYNRKVVKV